MKVSRSESAARGFGLSPLAPRAPQRLRAWLVRRERARIVGPLFAYGRAHARQLAHFVALGAALSALNLTLLYWLRSAFQLPDPLAVGLMYVLGALPHFIYHRWITYRVHDRPLRPQGVRYIVMLVSNFAFMQLLVAAASWASISPYVAVMASTACTMTANFLLMTHVVFARERRR